MLATNGSLLPCISHTIIMFIHINKLTIVILSSSWGGVFSLLELCSKLWLFTGIHTLYIRDSFCYIFTTKIFNHDEIVTTIFVLCDILMLLFNKRIGVNGSSIKFINNVINLWGYRAWHIESTPVYCWNCMLTSRCSSDHHSCCLIDSTSWIEMTIDIHLL